MSQENVEIVRSLYAGAAKLRCLDRGMSMPGWNRLTRRSNGRRRSHAAWRRRERVPRTGADARVLGRVAP